MLKQIEVARYLLRQDLVSAQSLVENDLWVEEATRRNSIFRITSEQSASYLLKQGVGPERAASVANEAALYRLLHAAGDDERLGRYMPRIYSYSPDEGILVLELLQDAQNLGDYYRRRGWFPPGTAAALGDALGRLHRIAITADSGAQEVVIYRSAPEVLALHYPDLRLFRHISYASLQLIRTIQQFPPICGLLNSLRAEWSYRCLVHYDVKFENLLVVRPERAGRSRLKIVDWELAGMGDPCWDVGSVFGEYLGFWLLSIPITGEHPPDHFLALARYPLHKIQPAIRSFWQAYVDRMGLDPATAMQWLLRAVGFSAARLIQTALEQSQAGVQLTGNTLCFLQLSFNILQRPHEAAMHLLGIPLVAEGRSDLRPA